MSTNVGDQTKLIINWSGIEITVCYEVNWLNQEIIHLELRCNEQLPITETGYRSHFMHHSVLEPYDGNITTFILAWLEDASQSTNWKRYRTHTRQGDLFDP